MRKRKRDFFVSRIVAGYYRIKINDEVLYVYPASDDVEYEAAELYEEVYEDAYTDGLITLDDSYDILMYKGLWTEKNEEDLTLAPENIEKLKMEIYRAALKSNTRKRIRERLRITEHEYDRLHSLKNCLQQYTCEGLANYARWNYIIEHTTFFLVNKPYDWNKYTVHHVLSKYNQQLLSPEDIRELAHNEPWYSLWSMKKKNGHIFDEPWTVEQKGIVNWSSLYDNIQESPECPSQEIIDDDDMLDGWLIIQRKEREKQQTKKQGEEAISQNEKIRNADEVFIPVETAKDAEKIHALNSTQSNMIRKKRLKQTQEKGTVKHGEFKDVVQEYKMKAQQEFNNRMKR